MFKRPGLKSVRIRRSNFRFQIQNYRRHDEREEVYFGFFLLVCKRRNEFGTTTYRILQESGTISTCGNLVSVG